MIFTSHHITLHDQKKIMHINIWTLKERVSKRQYRRETCPGFRAHSLNGSGRLGITRGLGISGSVWASHLGLELGEEGLGVQDVGEGRQAHATQESHEEPEGEARVVQFWSAFDIL